MAAQNNARLDRTGLGDIQLKLNYGMFHYSIYTLIANANRVLMTGAQRLG